MSGVIALRAVLIADGSLTGLVGPDRIAAGPLPQDTALPAIALQSISTVDMNLPAPASTRFVKERVRATVLAAGYDQMRAVKAAIRHAAADRLYPAISGLSGTGISGVTIHTDGAGPEMFLDEVGIYQASQDFMVRYSETR